MLYNCYYPTKNKIAAVADVKIFSKINWYSGFLVFTAIILVIRVSRIPFCKENKNPADSIKITS